MRTVALRGATPSRAPISSTQERTALRRWLSTTGTAVAPGRAATARLAVVTVSSPTCARLAVSVKGLPATARR